MLPLITGVGNTSSVQFGRERKNDDKQVVVPERGEEALEVERLMLV